MSDPDPAGVRLAVLAERTGARLEGDGEVVVHRVATLENAGEGGIAFLANPKYRGRLAGTRASALILCAADAAHTGKPKLVSEQPYVTFAKVAAMLHPAPRPRGGVHPSAVLDASASIAPDASIGPFASVGAGATVGEGAAIGAGGAVGEGAAIGAGATLHPNVVVYAGCVIGPRTTVHAGAVIGADGFGMAEEGGRWLRIPQVGRVVIGADCEIGANTTIDRGAIDDTVIGDDVKLDNQIQVGHNCTIGRHTAIAGCVGIAGSTRIGANCRIGGAAMISGHLTIPDGTVIGGATVVLHELERPGAYSGSFPALPYREWLKVAARLRRLDELAERVRALERALAARGER
ncbi:MAG: UDP-3-O-(3-hydroxymyristoyl)glucosamine N-acyltransferase [Burkholderiales bacterium]|nr:UDP-3-O-(3-hydroxymyristoyl)glucosamine N-acyltransferase [Burkholderiales bacterium]